MPYCEKNKKNTGHDSFSKTYGKRKTSLSKQGMAKGTRKEAARGPSSYGGQRKKK